MAYDIYVYDGAHWQHVLERGEGHPVSSAVLSEMVNAAPVLSFRVYSDHPSLSYLLAAINSPLPAEGQPTIMARREGSTVFEGRIYQHSLDDLTGAHDFTCEGMLARLNDYTVMPYSYTGTVEGYLATLLRYCEGALAVGTVTVTDPNDYIVRSSDSPVMLWDEIASKCIGSTLGGYIRMRDGYIVDWLAQHPSAAATQIVAAGNNVTELNIDVQPRDMYSGVLAYGAPLGITDSKGVPMYCSLSQLSAYDVPDGYTLKGMTLFKDSLVEQIGERVAIVNYDSVTLVSNLLSRAMSFLSQQSTVPAVKVGAIDLRDAGYEYDAIECGAAVTISGATFRGTKMCTAITRDLLDPSNTTFEFGDPEAITSGGSSGGSGGGGSITSPHFWHTDVEATSAKAGHTLTGFSPEPLDAILTQVENGYRAIDGGSAWIIRTPPHGNVSYDSSAFHLRANGLTARIVSPSLTTCENTLALTGVTATLKGANTDTGAEASVATDGYNGKVRLSATSGTEVTGDLAVVGTLTSDDITYSTGGGEIQLANPNKTARMSLTATPNLRIDTSSNGGSTWTTHGYAFLSGTSRAANTVLAAPNGSAGGASFRRLLPTDTLAQTANGDYYDSNVSTAVSVASVAGTATTGGTNVTSLSLGKGLWLVSAGVNFAANSSGVRKVVVTTTSGALGTTNSTGTAASSPACNAGTTRVQACGIVIVNTDPTTLYVVAGQSSGSALNATARVRAIRLASNS